MQGPFSGRISQKTYAKATAFIWILKLTIILNFFMFLRQPSELRQPFAIGGMLLILGLWCYHVQLAVRRFHDIGRSGSWAWALLVPLANLYFHAVLLFRKGDPDDNAYGYKPVDAGTEYSLPLVIAVVALFFVTGFGWSNLRGKTEVRMIADPVSFTITEVSLQERLQRTPCHAQSAYELSQSYLRTAHYHAALELEKTFHARCSSKVIQLTWAAFEAAKELHNFSLAEQIVGDLIKKHPRDADYRAWRGLLYEEQGMLQKAAHDFEEVIRLKPKIRNIPLNLVDAYRQLGESCKARSVQERYTRIYPHVLQDGEIQDLQKDLQKKCPTLSPEALPGIAPEMRSSNQDTQAAAG